MAIEDLGTMIPTGESSTHGTSHGTSSATSQSTSGPVATPQSELSLLLSRAAQQTGQNVYNWAQSTLAPDQYMTDQAIGHYMSAANTQEGLANQTAQQYNRITSPELVAQANQAATYNSAARQQVEAGHAEAQALQGSYAGIQNAEQQLQAYGVRPDSGVYQELNRATQAGAGAAAAASGTQAAQHVTDTGRQMLGQAIATGQQLPGQSVNSANAANQAVSGAQNAQLAKTTTGAQALGAAQPYLQTASNLTPESTAAQSSSASQSEETGSNDAHSTTQTFTPMVYTGPQHTPGIFVRHGGAIPALAGGGELTAKKMTAHIPAAPHAPELAPQHMIIPHIKMKGEPKNKGPGKGDVTSDNADQKALQEMGYLGSGGGGGGGRHHYGPASSMANEAADDGGKGGGGGGHGKPSGNKSSSDSSPSSSGPASIGAGGLPPSAGPSADPSSSGPSQGAIPSPSPGAPLDIRPPAQSAPAPMAGGGGGGDFAAGGAIPSPTTGGHVNRNLSPSHGAKTDDIPAQLNADEFVMPRDVAKYYGQKTFQDMILKARKAMGNHDQTPAAPTLKPATGQAPRFVSQHMADGGMPLAGIPSPGQATGDTASMNDPARSQYTTQFNHQDAGSQWQ